jgi:hypothetical protein
MNILLYARIGGVLLLALPIILKEVSKILAEIPGEQPGEVLIKEKIQPVLMVWPVRSQASYSSDLPPTHPLHSGEGFSEESCGTAPRGAGQSPRGLLC